MSYRTRLYLFIDLVEQAELARKELQFLYTRMSKIDLLEALNKILVAGLLRQVIPFMMSNYVYYWTN